MFTHRHNTQTRNALAVQGYCSINPNVQSLGDAERQRNSVNTLSRARTHTSERERDSERERERERERDFQDDTDSAHFSSASPSSERCDVNKDTRWWTQTSKLLWGLMLQRWWKQTSKLWWGKRTLEKRKNSLLSLWHGKGKAPVRFEATHGNVTPSNHHARSAALFHMYGRTRYREASRSGGTVPSADAPWPQWQFK